MTKNTFINIENISCSMFEKKYGLFTRNGRTAIWLLLEALGFERKKIIVPANICFAVISAITLSNNEPYFVDIDDNFSIDPDQLKSISSSDAAGIVFPHMYGNTGNIEEVAEIARDKGWIVIEDAAQSLGAKIEDRYTGSFTDFSITSFGVGKIIDVTTGGMLCLNSKALYKKSVEIYRKLNRSDLGKDFTNQLEAKIKDLQHEHKIRQENAMVFQATLGHENIQTIQHNEGATYWRQNILVKENRDGLLKYLKENKVKASKYFPSIGKSFCIGNDRKFERSDSMAEQVINLWPGRETSRGDIARINDLIYRFYNRSRERLVKI